MGREKELEVEGKKSEKLKKQMKNTDKDGPIFLFPTRYSYSKIGSTQKSEKMKTIEL